MTLENISDYNLYDWGTLSIAENILYREENFAARTLNWRKIFEESFFFKLVKKEMSMDMTLGFKMTMIAQWEIYLRQKMTCSLNDEQCENS